MLFCCPFTSSSSFSPSCFAPSPPLPPPHPSLLPLHLMFPLLFLFRRFTSSSSSSSLSCFPPSPPLYPLSHLLCPFTSSSSFLLFPSFLCRPFTSPPSVSPSCIAPSPPLPSPHPSFAAPSPHVPSPSPVSSLHLLFLILLSVLLPPFTSSLSLFSSALPLHLLLFLSSFLILLCRPFTSPPSVSPSCIAPLL